MVRIELNSNDDMKMEPILITPAIQNQHSPSLPVFAFERQRQMVVLFRVRNK
jgi:hypothetical protein